MVSLLTSHSLSISSFCVYVSPFFSQFYLFLLATSPLPLVQERQVSGSKLRHASSAASSSKENCRTINRCPSLQPLWGCAEVLHDCTAPDQEWRRSIVHISSLSGRFSYPIRLAMTTEVSIPLGTIYVPLLT